MPKPCVHAGTRKEKTNGMQEPQKAILPKASFPDKQAGCWLPPKRNKVARCKRIQMAQAKRSMQTAHDENAETPLGTM